MAYCDVLPLFAILNDSIAKGDFYEQDKPRGSDALFGGSFYCRDCLSQSELLSSDGQPLHISLPRDGCLHFR